MTPIPSVLEPLKGGPRQQPASLANDTGEIDMDGDQRPHHAGVPQSVRAPQVAPEGVAGPAVANQAMRLARHVAAGDGIVADMFWVKYGVEHLRHIVADMDESGDSARTRHVFSLGPQLQSTHQDFLASLAQTLAFDEPLQSGEVESFDFQSDERAIVLGVADGNAGVWEHLPAVLFFRIVSTHAARHKLVRDSVRIQRSDTLVVSRVELAHVDIASRTLRVYVESGDGSASADLDILTPGALSSDDFTTLRIWDVGSRLLYTCGRHTPQRLVDPLTFVIGGMLDARAKAADGAYVYKQCDDPTSERIEALEFLKVRGLATCVLIDDRSLWCLTDDGKSKLQVSYYLENPRLALSKRPGRRLADMSVFELMCTLREEGWASAVLGPHDGGKLGKALPADRKPLAYTPGGAKTWWIHHRDQTVKSAYLLCLLRAAEHGRLVEHFKPLAYYQAMLEGRDWQPRRRAVDFQFAASADITLQQPAPKRRRKAPVVHRARAHPAHVESAGSDNDDDADAAVEEDEDASGSSEDDSPETDSGDEEGQCPSDDTSSSSSSSSASSGRSDSNLAGGRTPTAVPHASSSADVPPAVDQPQVAPGAGMEQVDAERDVPQAPNRFAESFRWKGFKFTKTFTGDRVHKGWECTCYLAEHRLVRNPCRKTKNFTRGERGAEDLVLRQLKSWALAIFDQSLPTRESHVRLPLMSQGLPSQQALDAIPANVDDEGARE